MGECSGLSKLDRANGVGVSGRRRAAGGRGARVVRCVGVVDGDEVNGSAAAWWDAPRSERMPTVHTSAKSPSHALRRKGLENLNREAGSIPARRVCPVPRWARRGVKHEEEGEEDD